MSPCWVFTIILVFMELSIKETDAFTSWQEPPIPSANGSAESSVALKENHALNTSTGITLKVLGGIGKVFYFVRNSIHFRVVPDSGELFLQSALDYETSAFLNVTIGAEDHDYPNPKTCTAYMIVRIINVNDNPPAFSSDFTASTLESTPEGGLVLSISAVDLDGLGSINYSFTNTSADDHFRLNSTTGKITVARPLMAFMQPVYYMKAMAVDGGGPDSVSLTATTWVTIHVLEDINKTRCEPNQLSVNVSNDLRIGEKIFLEVNCSNWLRYNPVFVLSDDAKQGIQHFNVSATNKRPYLILALSNPTSAWQGKVHVYDGPLMQNIINIIPLAIYPVSINDPPTISPFFLPLHILENTSVGTVIGHLTVHDPDEGDWGKLRVLSYDKPNFIGFGPIANDQVPIVIVSPPDVDIYKNDDREPQRRFARQVGPEYYDEPRYNDEGVYSYGNILEFTVGVLDAPGLNATATVSLNITDVNDNAPVCNQNKIIKKIPRDLGVERDIVTLERMCTDADLSMNNSMLRYFKMNDSCSGFNVFEFSGTVSIMTEAFTQPSCLLVVHVVDSGTPPLKTHVTIDIQFLECPNDTDYLGVHWDRGVPGEYMWMLCPKTLLSEGRVTRFCDENGTYHDPVYNCTRVEIREIYRKLFIESRTNTISSILDDLVNVTSDDNSTDSILMIGDVETVNKILSKITDVVSANSTDIQNISKSYIDVVDNIMSENMTRTWRILINETGTGADSAIENLDHFVEKIASAPDSNLSSTVFAKTNLLLKIGMNISCDKGIHFPNRTFDVVPGWAVNTLDRVDMPCSKSQAQNSYSCALYRDISKMIPSRSARNKSHETINAPVMSFTYYPKIVGILDSPVEITFQTFDMKLENPTCSFWTKNSSTNYGFWSSEGCWLHMHDKEKHVVSCRCNHLTNFAVLMSPSSEASSPDSIHHVALSVISITGCILSMLCLVLTVVIHVILWRTVKSVRAIININLASSLFVAYLLFLTGVDQTENKSVCTAIAVLLHLLFLVVFFTMLTEGLNLAYTVLKPLSTRKPGIPLLVASYILAVVTVGISMAAVQLEGYGTDSFCWLSTDTGLIWAFIAPVLFIILVNGVIMCLVIRKMCSTVAMSRKTNKEKAKAGIRSVLVLLPIMGVTWVFGIFSVHENAMIFQYLFAIFNSLQGLLIFIFHCAMNKKIKDGLRKMIGRTKFLSFTSSSSGETQKPVSKGQSTQGTDL